MEAAQLHGAWGFARWAITHSDGRISTPFGADAEGLLLYTADGCMTATIMAAGRAVLSGASPRQASQAEKARAFDTYFSYAGRWRLEGDCVVHEVQVALNPAMIGTLQWREASLQGQQLILSAKENTSDGERLHALTWQRIGGQA